MKDMFGADHQEPDAYQEYINSRKWKLIRESKLKETEYKCEKCGVSKYSKKLEVHHLHYQTMGRERMCDLMVLCQECHRLADSERVIETAEIIESHRKAGALNSFLDENSRLYKGFVGWLENRYGWDWEAKRNIAGLKADYKSFLKWIRVL